LSTLLFREVTGLAAVNARDLERELDDFLSPEDVRVVDVTICGAGGRTILRVSIDRTGGVTVGDCASVSRLLSDWLEEHDPFPVKYVLEVSSPGIGRLLKRKRDYEVFAGRRVMVTLNENDGETSTISGILNGLELEEIVLTGTGGEQHRVPLALVAKAALE
jgi:ribosome maturation factor RimP